jgi:hypothetical protein
MMQHMHIQLIVDACMLHHLVCSRNALYGQEPGASFALDPGSRRAVSHCQTHIAVCIVSFTAQIDTRVTYGCICT